MRRAYTLVEVLVACALVSTLSGLLFPALSRATGRARAAACTSRLHQLWLGYRMASLDRGVPLRDVLSEETYPYVGEPLWRCVTSEEDERRYYLRLPLPETSSEDLPFVGDSWHSGTWIWVTAGGTVRTSAQPWPCPEARP